MASISSLGAGSGIDLEGLVTSLIAASAAPTTNRLNIKEAGIQSELSAFGVLKSALSEFQTSIAGLANSSGFQARRSSSSNEDAFTVSASNTASTGNFSVDVTSLSAAHTLATPANDVNYSFSSPDAVVGTGSLTFKFGATTFVEPPSFSYAFAQNAEKSTQTVTIDSTNNTLEGIKNKINDLDIGVTASIIKDGSEYRLAFVSSDTGVDNSLQVTVNDTGDAVNTDASGLSRLAFYGEGANDYTHLEQTATAADAALTLNGIDITSASNSIVDVIDGVTIDLVAAGSGSLAISEDRSAATRAVDSFISSYNDLTNTFNSLSSYDADSEVAGTLLGDSTLRTITNRLRNVIQDPISGLTGAYDSLSSAGITTDSNGNLVKDAVKFQKILDNDFDAISKLFSAGGVLSDALVDFDSSTADTKVGTYGINISQLALQTTFVGGSAATGAPGAIVIGTGTTDVFSLKVDGVQSGSLTLTAGSYTGDNLAKEIQSRINGDQTLLNSDVSVSVAFNATSNKFEITSDRYGSASKIENLSGNALANLGLDSQDVANSVDGVDVVGTIGGSAASGSGRFLTGEGNAKGLKIEITGGATGDRGSVVFSRGYADQLDSLLAAFLEDDNIIESRTDGLAQQIDEINDDRETLGRRLQVQEARLRSQFSGLDTLISQLNSTSGFLQSQLSNINSIVTSNLNRNNN